LYSVESGPREHVAYFSAAIAYTYLVAERTKDAAWTIRTGEMNDTSGVCVSKDFIVVNGAFQALEVIGWLIQ
jgi:hypothetical protein